MFDAPQSAPMMAAGRPPRQGDLRACASFLLCLTVGGARSLLADLAVAHVCAHLIAGPRVRIAVAAAAAGLDDQGGALAEGRRRLGGDPLFAAAGAPNDGMGLGAFRAAMEAGGAE